MINWFEIPVTDIDRAVDFYSKVLGTELPREKMMNIEMAFLPFGEGDVSGALCLGEGYKPSTDGVMIYLNGGEDLEKPLSKVESAGGQVIMPKTKISDETGYMAVFIDPEGNRIAFHSYK
jgi:predicted enzyme related to lactoylglutathione lyase